MSHTLGVSDSLPSCHGYWCFCILCEVHAEKEETFEYQPQLPWLLGVFSVRFPLNLKILELIAAEEKNLSQYGLDG